MVGNNTANYLNETLVNGDVIYCRVTSSNTCTSPQIVNTNSVTVNIVPAARNYKIISVDLPSGLPSEGIGSGHIIKADEVFTFQVPKLSFFNKENATFIKNFVVGDIGLHEEFLPTEPSPFTYVDKVVIRSLYKKRSDFQHKGDFGHALIVAGQKGSLGAAVLSSKAALKVGAGLVTAAVPDIGFDILQISLPEAMVISSGESNFTKELIFGENKYTIGCGPGLGQEAITATAFRNLLTTQQKPLVLDADALNIISKDKTLWDIIPKNSILTPHPFGANHTQNNECQRSGNTAMEPGSASTIMGYAGICDPNIQNNSDPYFHAISIQEIPNFVVAGNGNTCAQLIDIPNNKPEVTVAQNSFTIPISTAFALTASAIDRDGDPITYCWEQMNKEVATMPRGGSSMVPYIQSIKPNHILY